jgi:hypothetical protein
MLPRSPIVHTHIGKIIVPTIYLYMNKKKWWIFGGSLLEGIRQCDQSEIARTVRIHEFGMRMVNIENILSF